VILAGARGRNVGALTRWEKRRFMTEENEQTSKEPKKFIEHEIAAEPFDCTGFEHRAVDHEIRAGGETESSKRGHASFSRLSGVYLPAHIRFAPENRPF
jgi:hypothetical protein